MQSAKFRGLFVILILTALAGVASAQARGGAATAPATRPWILGSGTTKPIFIPATMPQDKRPELSLHFDPTVGVLIVTLTNNSPVPIVVDHELVVPLYFTFFNDRDLPIRAETVEGADPERGNLDERFAKLEPGKSVTRYIDLTSSFPAWVSGSVSTLINDEQHQVAFGREKFRRLVPGSKVKRVQVVYAIMPADQDAIPSYCERTMEDLCAIPMTATITLPDSPAPPKP